MTTTPTKRIRLTEMKAAYMSRHSRKITNVEIARIAFKGLPIKAGRRGELLSHWDAGVRLHHLSDRILKGICEALGCTEADLLGE